MIKYIGSKRLLVQFICDQIPPNAKVLDVFSGTSRVGHFLKKRGQWVIANDLAAFAKVMADCYVVADALRYKSAAVKLVKEYNSGGRSHGYFTETFCEKSRFFTPSNGERIDFIREDLEGKSLDPLLKSIMLTSLMEAADRVDSTCGIQMAYLKSWAPRAHNELTLRLPDLLPGGGEAYQLDAKEFASQVEGDVAYLDPPYNQHSYWGNYHIWESLCLWDKPEVYGKACKRIDIKDKKSNFNFKNRAFDELKQVVKALKVDKIIISFSNEGFVSRPEMEDFLNTVGDLKVVERDYKRYVGAQIGIYSPSGLKVGRISHLRNQEFLYVVEVDRHSNQAVVPLTEGLRDVPVLGQ